MIPMRTSSIFKSRWMALVWALGILWLAWDVAGSAPPEANTTANAEAQTDVTGAPITDDDANKVSDALNGL